MQNLFKTLLVALGLLLASISLLNAQENPFGTEGIDHTGLAVSKLDESVGFFTDVLGWRIVGGDPDYPSVFLSNGKTLITLWRVEFPATATPFHRRKNIGLHHLAIRMESLEKLHALHKRLKEVDNVKIEFAPEFLGSGPTTHMMIYEPSGIRLEFIVPGDRIKQ